MWNFFGGYGGIRDLSFFFWNISKFLGNDDIVFFVISIMWIGVLISFVCIYCIWFIIILLIVMICI